MSLTETSSSKCFGGVQKIFSHDSKELGCKMNFAIYLPPQAEDGKVPLIFWLSGLTCTEQNFITKAGAQRAAAEHGVAIVCPDTSPRGLNIPGEDESWDFGSGAGFYVNAVVDPWKKNYRMYSYVTQELPELFFLTKFQSWDTGDPYLHELLPENFVKACQAVNMPVVLQMREGYDHGYYFIASFIDEHIKHHARYLKA
ncbi:hypothetical protein FOCC_FOCC005853 [Frankliniella occidentalis]|nr:hypothetical protein FOCC_FOCC005853 [Frankliniella occidentalis]